ncbi:hypothetical protein C0J52_01481 [Blattella germanica]|nr:hypothetical protein C0J52_01481 [Blattella germanica]
MAGSGARLFHCAIALFFFCMDVLYFFKVIEVFSARTDLLYKHWPGLGLQFFTVWSQEWERDSPEGPELLRHIQRGLRMFKAVFFTSVVIPTAILVAVNYWTLNTLLDPALIEDTQVLQRYVPLWMDHTLHTAVVPFAILELLLAHRPYPRWKALGRVRSTFVVLSYTSWVVFCVLVGGAWPYPYLQRMTVAQRLTYLLINCALAAWSYSASDVINAAVWGMYENDAKLYNSGSSTSEVALIRASVRLIRAVILYKRI